MEQSLTVIGPTYETFTVPGGLLHRVTDVEGRVKESFEPRPANPCDVYWGSHGCRLERGHDGPHLCCNASVGKPPYYGPDTRFFGDDA